MALVAVCDTDGGPRGRTRRDGADMMSGREAEYFDNSTAIAPFRLAAPYEHGKPVGAVDSPAWTPKEIIV